MSKQLYKSHLGLSTPGAKPPLPDGWSCKVSSSFPDHVYYFNHLTGEKTWKLSDLFPEGLQHDGSCWSSKVLASLGVEELSAILTIQNNKLEELKLRGPVSPHQRTHLNTHQRSHLSTHQRSHLSTHQRSHLSTHQRTHLSTHQRTHLSTHQRTHLSTHQRDPDTQQKRGPDTQQQRDPDTQQQRGPVIPQQRDPDTQQQRDPVTQQQRGPIIPQQRGPDTQQQRDPDTQQQRDPDTQQQRGPDTQQQSVGSAIPNQWGGFVIPKPKRMKNVSFAPTESEEANDGFVASKDTLAVGEKRSWSRKCVFDMKQFVKQDGGGYSCVLCDKSFSLRSNCNKHVTLTHLDMCWVCRGCGVKRKSKQAVNTHIRKSHGVSSDVGFDVQYNSL